MCETVIHEKTAKTPIVIGVAGGSGSGKSTFVGQLQKALSPLQVCSISTDQFFRMPLPTMVSPSTSRVYEDWNSPDSIDKDSLLETLTAQISAESGNDVILVEGLSVLFFEDLLKLMDLKIFIELDSDERMYRRIKRNMKMWGVSMEEVADYYLESAKYAEEKNFLPTKIKADLIINGNHNFEKTIGIIRAWIQTQL